MDKGEVPTGAVETNPTSIHEDVGLIPDLPQWVMNTALYELWGKLQTWLRSGVAVVVPQVGQQLQF